MIKLTAMPEWGRVMNAMPYKASTLAQVETSIGTVQDHNLLSDLNLSISSTSEDVLIAWRCRNNADKREKNRDAQY